jgi:hypothetical protein
MNSEQDVLRALQALGESDRDVQAPAAVERRLRLAFRRRGAEQSVKRWRRISALAIAAGVVIAMIVTYARGSRPVRITPAQAPIERATAVAAPVLLPAIAVSTRKARPRHAVEQEIVTDFFPLMDVPPPLGRGALVRVSLPAEAMRTVGLPVREDRLAERVQADILLSEEGLATAIRFIKVSQ